MKFKLITSGYFYSREDVERYRKLGFTFKDTEGVNGFSINPTLGEIQINTLVELLSFANSYGEIIVRGDDRIEIYDDYRE